MENHQNEGAEAHDAQRKAEKIAQFEEEKAPGRSYSCLLQVPNGGNREDSQTLLKGLQQELETIGTNCSEKSVRCKEKMLQNGDGQTLKHVVQRD